MAQKLQVKRSTLASLQFEHIFWLSLELLADFVTDFVPISAGKTLSNFVPFLPILPTILLLLIFSTNGFDWLQGYRSMIWK